MKKITILLLVLTATAFRLFADPAEGYWLSIDDKTKKVTAGWHIYVENGILYGKILSMADWPPETLAESCKENYDNVDYPIPGKVNQMPVVGTIWLWGLSISKPGEWKGGKIIEPDTGKVYWGSVTFRPADGKKYLTDTLEMRGSLDKAGLLGRSQNWRKSTLQEASSLRPN